MLNVYYRTLDKQIKARLKGWSIYELVVLCGCILSAALMYLRAFYGTEITDEAYYVSDALAMIQGNIPYAYNNFSYGTGSAFLLIPQLFLYKLFVPGLQGVVLFTRLSFVTFRMLPLIAVYRVLRKEANRVNALLLVGLMIPYYVGGMINYSYNTIPFTLSLLTAALLYDAVEYPNKYSIVKLTVSGFLSGISVLAHPGYGLAVMLFLVLIVLRAKKGRKCRYTCAYIAGGILEILTVVIPVICQVGADTLWRGVQVKLHPYPTTPMSSTPKAIKLMEVMDTAKPMLVLGGILFVAVLLFSTRYIREKEQKLSGREYRFLGFSVGILALVGVLCLSHDATDFGRLGVLGTICVVVCFLMGEQKRHPVLYYFGIYPVLFSYAAIFAIDSSASVGRVAAAVPVLVPVFLILLESKSELVKWVTTISVVACIVMVGFIDFTYMYRDDPIPLLDYRVEEGVYKGLYTTRTRAEDLPELEAYLNGAVEEGEYVAFRDNVPCGYLMVHDGKPCDIATWDCLQYSYYRNTPAALYDYYRRRDAIPDKIIYVDYGRDENLSIDDEAFRYNDFVDAYYELVDDIALNDTFRRVMVYQYNGTFDGDYDYWIETYKGLP